MCYESTTRPALSSADCWVVAWPVFSVSDAVEQQMQEKERKVANADLVVGVMIKRSKLYRISRYHQCDCTHRGVRKEDTFCRFCGKRVNLINEEPIEDFNEDDMQFHDLTVIDTRDDDDFLIGECTSAYIGGTGETDYTAFSALELKKASAKVEKILKSTGLVKKPKIGVHLHLEN